MDIAFCTLDNVTYQASSFGNIDNHADKKRFLVCTECNRPAYFRGPTRNGREACFGARPHQDGCTLASQEHDGATIRYGKAVDKILATGKRIIIDFNHGAPANAVGGVPQDGCAGSVLGRTFTGAGTRTRQTGLRRMSSLLRALIVSEDFRTSDQRIQVTGRGEFKINAFFVNFSDVTDSHLNCYHGFWGMIPDARVDGNGTLWFNSGGREDISLLLDQRDVQALFDRYRIEDKDEIAGAYLLACGEVKRAPATGKRYVQIVDGNCLTLRLAR